MSINQLWLRRDRLSAACVSLALAAGVVFPAPGASASTLAPKAGSAAQPVTARGTSRTVSYSARPIGAAVSPDSGITCTMTIYTPVFNGFPYGESGSASVQCSAPVAGLYLAVGLYLDNSLVNETEGQSSSSAQVSKTTDYQPVSGTYQTGAEVWITFPAGYSPASETIGEYFSPAVNLQ